MKHLGVLLLPPGQDASPSQGYPAAECRRYPLIHVGEERQSGVKFLVQRNNATCKAWTPDLQIQSSRSRTPPQKEAYGCTNEAPVKGGGGGDFLRHSELVKYPATFSYSHLLPKFLATLLIRSKTVSSKKLFKLKLMVGFQPCGKVTNWQSIRYNFFILFA